MSTKKYSHGLKVELFYLVGMFRTLSPGDCISVALRKLLQESNRGSQAIYKFVSREQASEHQRSGIKLRNIAFYLWKDASLWAH